MKKAGWLDAGAAAVVAAVYLFVVTLLAAVVGRGPSDGLLVLVLTLTAVLVYLAHRVPANLLSVRPGPARIGPWGLAIDGSVFFGA
jgi:NADH:ubiquinone oxidoreductase subunit H